MDGGHSTAPRGHWNEDSLARRRLTWCLAASAAGPRSRLCGSKKPGGACDAPGHGKGKELPMHPHPTCSIDSCDKPIHARGWCVGHWRRWRRHGDPCGGRPHLSALERFWDKVNKRGANGCWLWTASTDPKGYGHFSLSGHLIGAHRFAYAQLVGRIPAELEIDHLCRTPACVNPAHLELVTGRENVRRGVGLAAQNMRKICCPSGHMYEGANLYILPKTGERYCRTCHNLRDRNKRAKARLTKYGRDAICVAGQQITC